MIYIFVGKITFKIINVPIVSHAYALEEELFNEALKFLFL